MEKFHKNGNFIFLKKHFRASFLLISLKKNKCEVKWSEGKGALDWLIYNMNRFTLPTWKVYNIWNSPSTGPASVKGKVPPVVQASFSSSKAYSENEQFFTQTKVIRYFSTLASPGKKLRWFSDAPLVRLLHPTESFWGHWVILGLSI